jgi:hypothetical protein
VAVIVTVYVPGAKLLVEEKVRVEVPVPELASTNVDGFTASEGPDGDTAALIKTLPDNPLMLETVMVELAEVPGEAVSEPGLAEIEKSTTCTTTCIEWVRDPLVPVIVTV